MSTHTFISKLVIVNIHCPSADAILVDYEQCLHNLEEVVNSHLHESTAIVIAGDFNAHLGTLAGPRGSGPPNHRGILLKQFIDRNNLFVSSHSRLSDGPPYTFHSGRNYSTVDYIITNRALCDFLFSSKGLVDHSLNISDHLPLSINLNIPTVKATLHTVYRINWDKALSTGEIYSFESAISSLFSPLLNTTCEDPAHLDQEVHYVCGEICKLADNLTKFSCKNQHRRNFFRDQQLKHLCKINKAAWRAWRDTGRPKSGELFKKKNAAKKEVRNKINELKARKDRLQAESMDKKFSERAKSRFCTPYEGKPCGSRLLLDGKLSTSKDDIIAAWASHFRYLSESRISESPSLQHIQSQTDYLHRCSMENEDFILDVPITVDGIEGVIKLLKRGKSSGPDGILSEHIIYGGLSLKLWLLKIFNNMVKFECMPECLNNATIVPIYKGKGKNPLSTNSYRGISLTSIIGKLFECILLHRMTPILEKNGIPNHTQSAYQAGLSCADPTEVVQEAVRSHIQHGSTVCISVFMISKRRLTQWNIVSFLTIFTNQESMESAGI